VGFVNRGHVATVARPWSSRPWSSECARLAARYWDLADPDRAADLAGILVVEQVRLVLHPETVNRYVF
jgi:hypothetical protein